MVDYSHCTGCLTFIDFISAGSEFKRRCHYSTYNEEGQCPCSTCIIKMMCQNICVDFHTFENSVKSKRE